jgi:hypothetical protein
VKHDRIKARPTMTRVLPEEKFKITSYPLARNGESVVMLPPETRILTGDSIGARPHVWTWEPAIPRNNPPIPFTFFVIDEHESFLPPQNATLIGAIRTVNVFIFQIGPDEP